MPEQGGGGRTPRETLRSAERAGASGRCGWYAISAVGPVPRVRRIAIDRDYERLQTPHRVQYACDTCSDQKERRRLGIDRG